MQLNHSVASQQQGEKTDSRGGGAAVLGAETRPLSSAAPLSTVLSSRFGHRPVVMLGGLLVSAGMVTAAFSQKVHHMYIAIGVVSGEHLPRARTFSGDSVSRMGSGEGMEMLWPHLLNQETFLLSCVFQDPQLNFIS